MQKPPATRAVPGGFRETCLAAVALLACSLTHPQQGAGAEVGGLLFGDAYYVASHRSADGEGSRGIVIRRGYLTFDTRFAGTWDARLRFELNQAGEFESYDVEVDVKDAFLARRFGEHRFVFGLSPTPTFDQIEASWGLRYLARTPMDLQGVASRDTGVAVQGPLNAEGTLSYRLMAGAGLQFGNESGDGRKYMGALTWSAGERWTVDAYLDHEKLSGPTDRTTWQLFAAFDGASLRWGAQYSSQDRQSDPPLELASIYVVSDLGERASLVGRIDRLFEPSVRGENISYLPFDPSAPATMFIGGLEFRRSPKLRLTPNIVYTRYERNDEGFRPDSDLHLRLTLFLDHE
ncbi:MAG: hypothetical protein OEW35_03920 [Gammaproteobacteria bacterium]|nr:hypothetical protein [Gammaproteobacteria bacterium]MDH4253504.1 hypothetical protein [Gammaproteobacteria bacterium]MDH5309737.1 hypothetical protein [Gammaproteobacteria bacterium]